MKVLFISSEVTPFAKVGGIADVVGALPIALQNIGVDARVMIPRYERIAGRPQLTTILDDVRVTADGRPELVKVLETTLPKSFVPVYLIENSTYLGHGWPIYDEHGEHRPFDGLKRFLFFSSAAVEAITHLGWRPDIIHCHDWHTGIIPPLLNHRDLTNIQTVFTIHNLAHQGAWNAADVFRFLGLRANSSPTLAKRDARGDLNLMQQGITASSRVNTVSPHYATEIITPALGERLDDDLRARGDEFSGILNGIDVDRYNPLTDPDLRVRFDAKTIDRRAENTLALHEQCGFSPDPDAPTFGFVGRVAEQKGLDLILEASDALLAAQARLVILGSGIPALEERLRSLAARYPKQVAVKIGFDAAFAQHIYAGADVFLMPSKFEPCGLGQMMAMRYGAIPIVRATGGLVDTVPDADDDPERGLGFAFVEPTGAALISTINRALSAWRDRPRWRALQQRAMSQDFSWRRSARAYLSLYQNVVG